MRGLIRAIAVECVVENLEQSIDLTIFVVDLGFGDLRELADENCRSIRDLFVASGLSVGVFYLFSAILAWKLGGLPAETLALMRGIAWAFALCFAAITVVSWRYLFATYVFSVMITVCLIAAAWLSSK